MTLANFADACRAAETVDDGFTIDVCNNPAHGTRDRICTTCGIPHLPTLLAVRYCACPEPNTGHMVRGVAFPSWQCQTCELPNRAAMLGLLPSDNGNATI